MSRIRFLLAILTITTLVGLAEAHTALAQNATPISVPTATSAGCDKIDAYVEGRQQIMDELIAGISAVFPDVATPIVEHGTELSVAMMAMTPEQTGKLATVYSDTADKIEKLAVPEIAGFYNEQIVVLYRTSAQAFDEAKTSDLVTAGQKYGEKLGAVSAAISSYGESAVAACPAFADVLQVDQTRVGA